MKVNHLPAILIGITVIVGVNLWVIERDAESFQRWCEGESAHTQSLACYPELRP